MARRAVAPCAATRPASKDALRLWLRLLACSNLIERQVRARLRKEFVATLPRFDLMAALERAPEGLSMGALSRRLMVSNGNVTGVVERLAREGLVKRSSPPGDRRSYEITLTKRGRSAFAAMAAAHEHWIGEFFAGLTAAEVETLVALLAKTKALLTPKTEGKDAA